MSLQTSCKSEALYDDFLSRFDGVDFSRDQVKKVIFAVLFSRNCVYKCYRRIVPYQKEKEQFDEVFPNTLMMIEVLKIKDHRKLAVLLQRVESMTFIDTICPRLVEEGIVPLTVHDSIIVEAGQADRAPKICQGVFEEDFGVILSFHINHLNSNSSDREGSSTGSKTSLLVEMESCEQNKNQCVSQEVAFRQSRKSA